MTPLYTGLVVRLEALIWGQQASERPDRHQGAMRPSKGCRFSPP
jgi:hypothetical protein